jgi:predicted enzyme related to lactoylglutathione lyase
MTTRRPTFVDRQGNRPPVEVSLKLESRDAVKLAKFFVAIGFVAEKRSDASGRQFIAAKADGVVLEIHPARDPKQPADWNMMLIVDDAEAAGARAVAQGGTLVGPLKEIPGGRKCVLESPEGQRVIVADKRPTPAGVAGYALAASAAPSQSRTAAAFPENKMAETVPLTALVEPGEALLVATAVTPAAASIADPMVESKSGGRGAQTSLARVPAGEPDSDAKLVSSTRLSAGIVVVAGIVGVFWQVFLKTVAQSTGVLEKIQAGDKSAMLGYAAALLVPAVVMIAGKILSCNKGERYADPSLVNKAIALEGLAIFLVIGSLGLALALSPAAPAPKTPNQTISGLVWTLLALAIVAAACIVLACLAFTTFLQNVSQGLGNRKAASSGRIVIMLFVAALVFLALDCLGLLAAWGYGKFVSAGPMDPKGMMAEIVFWIRSFLMAGSLATFAAAFILYVAFLIGYAVNMKMVAATTDDGED